MAAHRSCWWLSQGKNTPNLVMTDLNALEHPKLRQWAVQYSGAWFWLRFFQGGRLVTNFIIFQLNYVSENVLLWVRYVASDGHHLHKVEVSSWLCKFKYGERSVNLYPACTRQLDHLLSIENELHPSTWHTSTDLVCWYLKPCSWWSSLMQRSLIRLACAFFWKRLKRSCAQKLHIHQKLQKSAKWTITLWVLSHKSYCSLLLHARYSHSQITSNETCEVMKWCCEVVYRNDLAFKW